MKERIKSITLMVLVGVSLLQSYLLAYGTPNFDLIPQTEYVETELNGSKADMRNVIFPEQIVTHLGNKRHTVFPIDNQFYSMVSSDLMRDRSLDQLRKLNGVQTGVSWDILRDERPGIEIRFRQGVPLNVLQTIMPIKGDLSGYTDTITRILYYVKDTRDEVKVYLFTDSPLVVYEAGKTDITVRQLEQYVGFGEHLPSYHYHAASGSYLPNAPISMVRLKMPFTLFTQEQLKRSLFPDPSLTKFLFEKEGSQYYTDSKRILQMKNGQRWFLYTDPIAPPADNQTDIKGNLQNAVNFINQHGGWNSGYLLSGITPQETEGQQTLLFRQYIQNYPVLPAKPDTFGLIKVVMENGAVATYERSTINPDVQAAQRTEAQLPGGDALDALLAGVTKPIDSVYPAYQAVVTEQTVELVPRWAVELLDGSVEFLPAGK
ncbi:hypothetical protein J31TS4_38850 [Paenibacillus sp. J31TS4]|uniref:YycH family regulatory protein n=1 Tax=Paenibacillus sp. J31TS4 TaxID=2807195 RepID=UPI001B2B63FC|nr:two-component system activity regulator YycH [Paenibacillus sp. J31TS4]GIP40605.1 hypothetical protein J31TS4_38850 [Paenibacillus sp. J31TS4]